VYDHADEPISTPSEATRNASDLAMRRAASSISPMIGCALMPQVVHKLDTEAAVTDRAELDYVQPGRVWIADAEP
jgi:hypothetical protein